LSKFVYYKATNVNSSDIIKTYASKEGETNNEAFRVEPNLNSQANANFDNETPF
jgi:hypothetical protein